MRGENMFIKGQLRISESMIVLFVVFILFLFAFGFYIKELKSGINDKLKEERDFNNLLLINSLINSPEFGCSKDTVIESGCLDMKKIDSFIKLNNKEFYKKVFGKSVISVSGIYPNSFSYDRKIYDNAKENYD